MPLSDHFILAGDTLTPGPWMQQRRVATTNIEAVSRKYGVTGGQPKNDKLQTATVTWTNNSPMPQQVFGTVCHGSQHVNLQARSRGYIAASHGLSIGQGQTKPTIVEVSRIGGGGDIGQGGILGVGTGYGVHRLHHPPTTIPLCPQLTGLAIVQPGQTITATVETKFISEYWESVPIDRGDSDTTSNIYSGQIDLHLYATPLIGQTPKRLTPTVKTVATKTAVAAPVVIAKPIAVSTGDVLIAVCGNQLGLGQQIQPPAGWSTLIDMGQTIFGFGDTNLKVFTRVATDNEPTEYTFSNGTLAEEHVALIVLYNAVRPEGDINSSGWSTATVRRTYNQNYDIHAAPNVNSKGQLLICASFFANTILQSGGITQYAPSGMTETANLAGRSCSLAVARMANPPIPTGERNFTPSKKPVFAGKSACLSILIPGIESV